MPASTGFPRRGAEGHSSTPATSPTRTYAQCTRETHAERAQSEGERPHPAAGHGDPDGRGGERVRDAVVGLVHEVGDPEGRHRRPRAHGQRGQAQHRERGHHPVPGVAGSAVAAADPRIRGQADGQQGHRRERFVGRGHALRMMARAMVPTRMFQSGSGLPCRTCVCSKGEWPAATDAAMPTLNVRSLPSPRPYGRCRGAR